MANYMAAARTNYFRVINEKRYQELFNKLIAEDSIEDFTYETDGVLYHGFGSYASIDYLTEDEEYDFDEFLLELQKILPEDEAFIYMEAGHEKLRYVTGDVIIVTRKEIVFENSASWAVKKAKELLGEHFNTKVTY
jgi:hypothetical protein